MRNLKKVLSLSLALVMLLGMMVVGAGAATALDVYSDKGDITYKEAVDLLTAIDVLQGDDGGFRPTDTLTREQAAKIVATIALGVDAAEALTETKAPFTDVAATRWSAGYIAYCANVGIIDGMGNGTYLPTDEVTGYQFAKMLLSVLGYGANDEYVGSNWSLNVAKDGVTTGLFSRLGNVGKTPATREEAAQLAYNAIQMDMVTYSTLFGTYSKYVNAIGNDSATLLGTKAKNIFNVVKNTDNVDALGYSYEYWKYIGKTAAITDTYKTGEVLGTVTGGTVNAMKKDYDFADTLTVYENGELIGKNYKLGDMSLSNTVVGEIDTSALTNAGKPVVYNGQYIDVIDSNYDGEADKLVIVTYYLAEVTKVTAATASADRSVTLKVYLPNQYSTITTTLVTEDYAKGDLVLVAPSGSVNAISASTISDNAALVEAFGNIKAHQAAEVVSAGTVTAYYNNTTGKADGSVTTGGAKYSYNGVFATANAAMGSDVTYYLNKGTYNFYLDTLGNVIGVKTVEDTISDYAYLSAYTTTNWANGIDNTVNTVKVILSDGTVGTYTLAANSALADKTTAAVGTIYGYSFNSSNQIVLTDLSGVNNYAGVVNFTGATFSKGYTALTYSAGGTGVVYANDETVFVYNHGGTIYRYVGKSNAPTMSGVAGSLAYHTVGGTNYAEYVVINAQPNDVDTTNYLYVRSTDIVGNSTDTSGNRVYYYNVIKNGEATTIASAKTLSAVGVYTYTYNADAFISDNLNNVESGVYSLTQAVAGTRYITGIVDRISGNVMVLTDGTQVAFGDVDITIVDPLETEASISVGDEVIAVISSKNANGTLYVASSIYVTDTDNAVYTLNLVDGTGYIEFNVAETYSITGGETILIQMLKNDGGNRDWAGTNYSMVYSVNGTAQPAVSVTVQTAGSVEYIDFTYTVPAATSLTGNITITIDSFTDTTT